MPGIRLRIDASQVDQASNKARRAFQDIGQSAHRAESKIERAERSINSLDKTILAAGKSMISWQGALGAVAGAAGLGYVVNQSLDATKQLNKLSKQTGFSTKSIQELEFAARKAGVSSSRLQDALGEMAQRMGEAAADGGEMAEGFKAAGVAIDGLSRRNPQRVLYQVADAIKEADTQAQALNISVKTFGDEAGRDMVAMLRQGSEGLQDMAQRARDMGMVLGKDVVDNAANAEEKVSLLTDVLGKQFHHAVAELSPVIASAAGHMADLAASFGDMLYTSKQEELNQVNAEITKLEDRLKSMKMVSEEDQGILDKWLYGEQGEQIADVRDKLEDLREKRADLKEEVKEYNSALGNSTNQVRDHNEAVKSAIEKYREWQNHVDGTEEIVSRSATSIAALAERNRELVTSYQDIALYGKEAVLKAQRTRAMRPPMVAKGNLAPAKDVDAGMGAVSDGIEQVRNRTETHFDYLEEFSRQTAENMQRNFSNLFFDTWTGELDSMSDAFEQFGHSLLRTWADIQSQMLARGLFGGDFMSGQGDMGGLFGTIASMFTGGPSAPGTAGFNPPAMGHSGGIVGHLPEYHDGGLAPNETPAILKKGEGVFTQEQMKALGQRQEKTVNLNVNIYAADARSVTELMKRNPQAVIGPVKEALNYGDMDLRQAVKGA
jgi:predicted  nucleic acid-binding Zn-ribbon protein